MEKDAQHVTEVLEKVDEKLDDYEKHLGIYIEPGEALTSAITKIFNLGTDITKISNDQCLEYAYQLAQYNFFLQKECNKYTSKIHWIENKIMELVAHDINNQHGYKHEEKLYKAIMSNQIARRWHSIKIICETRLKRISYLGPKIDAIRQTLIDIKMSRRGL